jgi:hypothetical protein
LVLLVALGLGDELAFSEALGLGDGLGFSVALGLGDGLVITVGLGLGDGLVAGVGVTAPVTNARSELANTTMNVLSNFMEESFLWG